VPEPAAVSAFEGLKADPGKSGVDKFQAEIEKLTGIRAVGGRYQAGEIEKFSANLFLANPRAATGRNASREN
jgi:hypothetical protein